MISSKGMAQFLFRFLVVVLTGTYNKEPYRSLGHDLCVAWWRHWSSDEYYQWESYIFDLKELVQNLLWFSVLHSRCPAILCLICLKLGQNSPNYDRIAPQKCKALYLNKWNKHKSLSFIRLVSLKFTLLHQEDVFFTPTQLDYSTHIPRC